MIFSNSRYANAPLVSAVTPGGDNVTAVYWTRNATKKSIPFDERIIVDGDRLDRLATQFYGDATQWWRIAQANPEIFYPEGDLPIGNILRIPRASSLTAF